MKISQFNKILYKGNINLDFYLFCLKRDVKLIRFLFINLWYYFLSYVFIKKRDLYIKKQYCYLSCVKDLDDALLIFRQQKNISNYFEINPDVIVDRIPTIFMTNYFKDIKVVGYELDKNYEVKLDKFNKDVIKIKSAKYLYLTNKYLYSSISSECCYIIYGKRMKYLSCRNKLNNRILQIALLISLSIIITCFSFMFTNSYLDINIFKSYFEKRLFILNLLPILMIILLMFFITKGVHTSWLITSFVILIWGIANQTKVFYRDDVVKFEDLTLIKEALIMTESCDLVIKSYTIIFVVLIILIYFFCRKNIKKLSMKKKNRCIVLILLSILSFFGYKTIYKNETIYNSVGDISLVNKWIFTRQSQIRGLVYPFVYSLEDGFLKAPDDYDEEKVESILSSYNYQDIPEDKKVNIIAIMLEAYNDFSKFDEIDFKEDIYKYFHEIQSSSISGNLVTNIFGGGTITTERNFLTGYTSFSNFRKRTNSYVWYFKEQGYRTEAMHPIYGAFYNRASINPNLGFDVYYNYENKYSKIQTNFVKDNLFFDTIIEGYEESKSDEVPYFNFSVTYQNHVPYDTSYYEGKEYYFENMGLDEVSYNTINQYFTGIKSTNEALKKLIDYFDKENEPVIIILFGDHNPALGDNASIYHDLGINISLDNEEGFLNYYETPYVIHANDGAKSLFNNSFVGQGDDISPIFLMNELFENMGLKGNEYLQYMSSLKEHVEVINSNYYKEDGIYVKVTDSSYKEEINEYGLINYYQLIH